MSVSWDLIRTFEAVAKSGSLSAAARQLRLAQPTVGRHIDLLEAQLRVPLFLRSREGMRLTEKGADLVAAATDMMTSATGFARVATGLEEDIHGTVRISVNEILGVLVLPHLLSDLLTAHPEIEVELSVNNTASDLLQRDADIALRMFRPMQNDLIAKKVTELPLGFYAHSRYLARRGQPARPADLLDHQMIGFDRETSMIEAANKLGLDFTPSHFTIRSDNTLAQIEAIRAGLGIGVTQKGLASRWPGVEQVLKHTALPLLELWIVCHSDVHHNKRIRRVVDFLSQRLKSPYANYTGH